jgi:hypothetical protein
MQPSRGGPFGAFTGQHPSQVLVLEIAGGLVLIASQDVHRLTSRLGGAATHRERLLP